MLIRQATAREDGITRSNEERGSRRWILDRLDELDEQNPALTPKDQGRPPSIQSRQLARVAFQKATEVLGHADKLHTEAENRKQRAIESDDDDEEFDYAEESQWEAKVLVDCALEHRERTLSRFSEEFTQALGAREQAKAELDANTVRAGRQSRVKHTNTSDKPTMISSKSGSGSLAK